MAIRQGFPWMTTLCLLEVLVCSTEPTNVGKFFVVKLYLCTFSVYENIFTMKIKRITVQILFMNMYPEP